MSFCVLHFPLDNSWSITENIKDLKVNSIRKFKYIINNKPKWFTGIVKHAGNCMV